MDNSRSGSSYGILKKDTQLTILIVMAIIVTIFLSFFLGNRFFSVNNFETMAFQVPEFGFLAIAMALAILTGGIDLSIVAIANLSGIVASLILSGKIPFFNNPNSLEIILLAILSAILVSTICGFINGLIIAKFSVPPILATLGTMLFFSGIGMALTNGQSVGIIADKFSTIFSKMFFGIPAIFIVFLAAIVAISILLSRTCFGQKVYLLGENSTALRFSGTNVEKITIKLYTLSGFLVGFSAIIMIARANSARVGFGDSYQLQAILVSILGGFDPNGGRGKVIGVALGMVILQFLQSSFTILNFSPYSKKLIWGFILLLVMMINYLITTKKISFKRLFNFPVHSSGKSMP
jgi:simple sugar transport system permease protein